MLLLIACEASNPQTLGGDGGLILDVRIFECVHVTRGTPPVLVCRIVTVCTYVHTYVVTCPVHTVHMFGTFSLSKELLLFSNTHFE